MKHVLLLAGLLFLTGCPQPPPPNAMDKTLARAAQAPRPLPVDTQALSDTLARAGRPSTTHDKVDSTTFPYPVLAGIKTADGYPVYLLHCELNACFDAADQRIGSLTEVAARLTPIRNIDATNPTYRCNWVCTDAQGHVVGAISPAMRAYLTLPPLPPSSLP